MEEEVYTSNKTKAQAWWGTECGDAEVRDCGSVGTYYRVSSDNRDRLVDEHLCWPKGFEGYAAHYAPPLFGVNLREHG